MSTEALEGLERAVEALLATEKSVTPEGIRDWINKFRLIPTFNISEEESEALARRFEVRHGVTMSIGSVLIEREFKPWLEGELAAIDFFYWNRYRKLLAEKHLSAKVISTLDAETDRILGFLENPAKDGPWSRRGMVVGHVQSGKTANYIGLIGKAADAGYRLIVVIAGVHNNLRNQTQKRIDEGFVGRDSARLLSQREDKYVGVGRFDQSRRPVTFTNSVKDFSKEMATGVGVPLQNLNEPVVFVIKKNSSTLKNLVEWLREHNASRGSKTVDAPMLLIDDEADNASINVRYGAGEVSLINGKIRELLTMFSRSCYVGYTATPFANIFIDPDTDDDMRGEDLFPRHFIVSLDPPSNYFGADRVFRDDSKAIIRHIEDNEDLLPMRHKKEHNIVALPQSLVTAIRTFIVGRAIRIARGDERQHSSMLVNASRFTGVQSQIRTLIQGFMGDIQASVRVNGALPSQQALRDPEIAALHAVWTEEFSKGDTKWATVQQHLVAAVAPIKTVEVNSRSHGNLNYDDYASTGLSVIAVGGYSLSRGLTLEGLMVSYFLRNSMMYDTLMQMGRWFGYRPGYDDLCKVWMPEEAEGWYAHVAESIEMLREELRRMAAAGATPEEFGLKVRAHPDTLIVTARNKMGSSEKIVVRIGLGNEFVETAILKNDSTSLKDNLRTVQRFVESLKESGHALSAGQESNGSWLLRDVPVAPIRTFITGFVNHPLSMLTDPGPVGRYIEDREDSELRLWDVLFVGVRTDREPDTSLGVPIVLQQRTAGTKSDSSTLRITNKQRVSSRGVERAGLSESDIGKAEKEFAADKEPGARLNYPDRIYRAVRSRPLLIIHLLEVLKPDGQGEKLHDQPVVAWSISFPETKRPEQRVEYVVTTNWLRENFREDLEDEEMESDDVG